MIRPATAEDWPLIEQWRDDHFADMAYRQIGPLRPVEGQIGFDDAVWVVLERDGAAVAVTAYTEIDRVRFGKAMFAAPGHVFDGMRLAKWLEQMCDDQGYELWASTDAENVGYIELLLKRGFSIASVELVRQPRKG